VISADGGDPRPLTSALERPVSAPRFARDGKGVFVMMEDGGEQHLLRVPLDGGAPVPVIGGARSVDAYDPLPDGHRRGTRERAHGCPTKYSPRAASGSGRSRSPTRRSRLALARDDRSRSPRTRRMAPSRVLSLQACRRRIGAAGSHPASGFTAVRWVNTTCRSPSKPSCWPPTGTRSSSPIRAAPRATAPSSPAPSRQTGATRISTT
jgi:hypothetical protein